MDSSAVWNGQDPTLSGPDDFHQFLDMNLGDGLQFDFQDFQQPQDTQMMQDDGNRMDMGMSNVVMGPDTSMQEAMPSVTSTSTYSTKAIIAHGHPSNDSLVELDAQIQFLQHQRHQQQQRQIQEQQRNYYAQNNMIPQTPNSVELHAGAAAQYYRQSNPQQQQQTMFDHYRMQAKEQDVSMGSRNSAWNWLT